MSVLVVEAAILSPYVIRAPSNNVFYDQYAVQVIRFDPRVREKMTRALLNDSVEKS